MLVEQDTKRYYSRKSTDWLSEMGAAAYIGHIDTVMGQEDHRCTAYLNPVTRPKLARALLETCIVAHRDTLFESAKEILCAAYDNSQVGLRHHASNGWCCVGYLTILYGGYTILWFLSRTF
jgi:hypothetical protein